MKPHPLLAASSWWNRYALVAAILSLGGMLWYQPVGAQTAIDPSLRVKILLTALSFDRALRQRAGESITFLTVGTCETRAVLESAAGKSISGLPIRMVDGSSEQAALRKQAADQKATVLFVCDAEGKQWDGFVKVAIDQKLIMMVENPDLVKKGASLGVYEEAGHPKLLLNPEVAKFSGADFDPRIFSVAKVVN